MTSTRDDVVITSSYLTGNQPVRSEHFNVHGIECKSEKGEFDYVNGLQEVWLSDKTMVNVEQDMEYSDELVDGLINCPWPLCAYAYTVYPTKLGHYIYCATSRKSDDEVSWLTEGEEWALWSSIGFCKIAPDARVKPLDRLFWQWVEHSINRIVGVYQNAGGANLSWHIHWPAVEHYHDYERVPDHLW